MSRRWLCICALLIFAFSTAFAQSLGDVARVSRAERQRSESHAKVITNDDLAPAESTADNTAPAVSTTEQSIAGKDGQEEAKNKAEPGNKDTVAKANPNESGSKVAKTPSDPAAARDQEEAERQKRTEEINQQYLSKIAELQKQIDAARIQLSKLQNEQLDNSYQYQRTSGTSQNPVRYEQEQRTFNQQVEEQRNLIESLSAQLEDAKESARHAGVPHTID